MAIDLRPTTPADAAELGRICYEAFKDISDRHGFPTDFASVEFAQQVMGILTRQEEIYGVAAVDGDAPKGSNFIMMAGEVVGLGPISVDVGSQGQGIGRRLMEAAIAHARERGHEMVRLCQDSFNMQSLALYASLGFEVKEPVAYLQLSSEAQGEPDPGFRPATASDLDQIADLCESVYGVSRRGEVAMFLQLGFPVFVLDRGHISGYLVSTAMGHGVAESDEEMLALLAGMGANAPEAHAFVPLRNGRLYREALAAGHRNQKVMNLMALGPYEEPQGTYCPSVLF